MKQNKRTNVAALVICLIAGSGMLVGCRNTDSADLIQQTGTTALVLAAAGFEGGFEVTAEPSSRFYLMEGVGADFPGSRVAARGTMNPGDVSIEKLEQIVTLLERLSRVKAGQTQQGETP